MSNAGFIFRRPDLAKTYSKTLMGDGFLDARAGLFLTAPRRTGKSTFLQQDLVPELESQDWVVVYVDLWENRDVDPALLIEQAISAKIALFDGAIAKLAKSAGLEKINLFGVFSISTNALTLPKGVSLADAIEVLVVASGKRVAIVIDEAQHAIATPDGITAMFSMKAARDRLNLGPSGQRMCLILTGSNRDKLVQLTLKRDQPFFGSFITPFPLLGREYTDAYADFVNVRLSFDQFDKDSMCEAFAIVGHRPQLLGNAVSTAAMSAQKGRLREVLIGAANDLRDSIWGSMESDVATLTPVQRAVLEVIIEQGSRYAPFNELSMKAYSEKLAKKIKSATVQAALDALRTKNLVWRASPGTYALEDESLALWYKQRHLRGGDKTA